MTVTAELCRDIAFEAWSRDPQVNPNELWAVLESVADIDPRIVVDLRPRPVEWWAWWSLGAHVIGATATPTDGYGFWRGILPSAVTEIVGDPRDSATRLRVADQLGGHAADVVVVGGSGDEEEIRAAFHAYAPMVREGGLVIVSGIAEEGSGSGRFWVGLDDATRSEMVGSADPYGYGIVEIHGRDTAHHG